MQLAEEWAAIKQELNTLKQANAALATDKTALQGTIDAQTKQIADLQQKLTDATNPANSELNAADTAALTEMDAEAQAFAAAQQPGSNGASATLK